MFCASIVSVAAPASMSSSAAKSWQLRPDPKGVKIRRLTLPGALLADELDKVFPVEVVGLLAEIEIEELEDEPSSTAVQDAVRGIEEAL
ncbi:hypothetical protein GE09DRAFT_1288770 [Coniochaeta sp. 2T2.1]|nr:hypothetical protein GE09DRAFT_1288770 [Coniochaeta sp. 2T2.1]